MIPPPANPSLSSQRRTRWLVVALVLVAIGRSAEWHFTQIRWDQEWPGWVQDIDFLWWDARQLRHGIDPYERTALGDMRHNQKYSTYLPGFYVLAVATQHDGQLFTDWLFMWKDIFWCTCVAIALVLTGELLLARQQALAAALACVFWLFNRWTLNVLEIGQIDFLPILFLLLSTLAMLRKRPVLAGVLLSLSLSFKQLAAIVVPIYLIGVWQMSEPSRRWRSLGRATVAVAALPIALALPFLIWHPRGFVASMLFSATRLADGHFYAPSFDALVGLNGPVGRTLLVWLLLAIYGLFYTRKIGLMSAVLFVLLAFVEFNSVLFRQYMAWVVPFVPLALCPGDEEKSGPAAQPLRTGGEATHAS